MVPTYTRGLQIVLRTEVRQGFTSEAICRLPVAERLAQSRSAHRYRCVISFGRQHHALYLPAHPHATCAAFSGLLKDQAIVLHTHQAATHSIFLLFHVFVAAARSWMDLLTGLLIVLRPDRREPVATVGAY